MWVVCLEKPVLQAMLVLCKLGGVLKGTDKHPPEGLKQASARPM